jgi:hypothetical protein
MEDSDRQRLREEEVFRDEVRKSLVKPKTRLQSIHSFFNTGLGLWFLGTVAATLVSTGYAYIQDSIKSRNELATREKKLTLEGGIRLMQWQTQMIALQAQSDAITPEDFKRHWNRLLAPPLLSENISTGIYPLHAEYERRSLVSLLFELSDISKDKATLEDKKALSDATEFFMEWDPITDRMSRLEEYFGILKKANVSLTFKNYTTKYTRKSDPAVKPPRVEEPALVVHPPPPVTPGRN